MKNNKITREEISKYFLKKKYKGGKFAHFIERNKLIFSIVSVFFLLFGVFLIWYIFHGLPSFEELENPKPSLASNIYSSDGKLLGQFFIENRIQVKYDSLPQNLINALIATEDRKFYSHWGVDIDRFVKAMLKNMAIIFGKGGGASTITQQVARNLYKLVEKEENTIDVALRKVREMITAIQIEKTYTKREILEMYFTISYFGRGAYGVESAARIYFGKTANKLSLHESALLIALLRNPFFYDPVKNPENAYGRRNLVLNLMYDTGYITEEEMIKAQDENIRIVRISEYTQSIAPHFIEYVRQFLLDKKQELNLNIYKDGLNIYTSLNYEMQIAANEAADEHLKEYQKLFNQKWRWNTELLNSIIDKAIKSQPNYILAKSDLRKQQIKKEFLSDKSFIDSVKTNSQTIEVGFVVLDPVTGEIRAMVGGANPKFMYGLNHVTQIRRQPGSAFKPIIYSTAIDNGAPICTELSNDPISIQIGNKTWTPGNSDGKYGGYLSLRKALAGSVNMISVRLINEGLAPLSEIPKYAKLMGIQSPIPTVYSLALGTCEITPLELTSAFATISNHGIHVSPMFINRIEDRNGIIIKDYKREYNEAFSPETAYLMTTILQSVVDQGTASGIRSIFHLPAAGKTGTTQDYADAWFVGFTPQLCAGVWVGFDDQRIKFTDWYGQGGKAAAPIWAKFMEKVYSNRKCGLTVKYFEPPEGIGQLSFCLTSLQKGQPKLAGPGCPKIVSDIANTKIDYSNCDLHSGGLNNIEKDTTKFEEW